MVPAAGGLFGEYVKDILTLLGVIGPIVLAAIAALIAAWQVIQGYNHNAKIELLKNEVSLLREDVAAYKRAGEQNRIYSELVNSLAINLASTDAIQEGRLAILEGTSGSAKLSAQVLSSKKAILASEYMRLLDEIALLSRSDDVRRQAALSLGAGSGDINSLFLLHELAALVPRDESSVHWKAVAMIRQRFIDQERSIQS